MSAAEECCQSEREPHVTLALTHRVEIGALVAEFRTLSTHLVDRARDAGVLEAYEAGEDYPDQVSTDDGAWWIYLHDPHCRFESATDGTVVEAHTGDPRLLDAGFLLEFARTSGRHEQVVALCTAGFHDMARILDVLDHEDGAEH